MNEKSNKVTEAHELTVLSFMVSEMLSYTWRDMEKRLSQIDIKLQQESKQNYNRLMQHIKAVKYCLEQNSDTLCCLPAKSWDNIQRDSRRLLRIAMLILDRCEGNDDKLKEIEENWQKIPSKGYVPESFINQLKLKEND